MVDFAMCDTKTCKKRLDCYRYTATPGYWQSMTVFGPDTDKIPCSHFKEIPNETIRGRYNRQRDS